MHEHAPDPAARAARPGAAIGPHPSTRPLMGGSAAVAVLQQLAGNQAVAGMLQQQRPVAPHGAAVLQRDAGAAPPTLGTRPTPGDSPNRLHLDPQIEAQIRAIEAMRALMAPEKVQAGLLDLNLPATPLIGPPTAPATPGVPAAPAPATVPGPAPGTGLSGPRAGTGGDIWKAVLSDPTLGPAVINLGDAAYARARLDYNSLSTGATVAVVSTSIAVGGGAIATLLANADTRRWIGATLNDKIIPVPKVPGLSVQLNLSGPAIIVGLHLDVGKILPASLGFGPASESTPLGAPPNPYATPSAQRQVADAAATPLLNHEDHDHPSPVHFGPAAVPTVSRHSATVSRAPDPASIAGQTGAVLGAPVSAQALQANATIAGGQTISRSGGNWVHTVDDTQLFIRVTNSKLVAAFTPHLVITADSGHWFVPNPDIYLTKVWFDFSTGAYGFEGSAPNYARWAGAGEKTLAAIGESLIKLPSRMRAGGYDPFTDPALVPDLQTMATSMAAGSGGGGAPKMDKAAFTAEAVLGADLSRDLGGGAAVALPAGTSLSLTVEPEGDVPTSGAEFANMKIRVIYMHLSNNATVRLNVLKVDLPVVSVSSAVLSRGGSLHLNYVLINESISAAWRELVRAGVAPGTLADATKDPSSPRGHAIVDEAIRKHLDPLIQQAILANKAVIPGLDLAKALGVPAGP